MKVRMRAIVTYEWGEDSENWSNPTPQTEEELVKQVREYALKDHQYFLECDIETVTIEKA